ncbi:MAG: hypothetical protein ACOZQL_19210 [Myxococcota bacterium]
MPPIDAEKLRAGATAHLEWQTPHAQWTDSVRAWGGLLLVHRHVVHHDGTHRWLMPASCICTTLPELDALERQRQGEGVRLISTTHEPGPPPPVPSEAFAAAHAQRRLELANFSSWVVHVGLEERAIIIDANQAFTWFLDTRGVVYRLDLDDVRQAFTPEQEPRLILSSLRHATEQLPWVRELIPPRPTDAAVCAGCGGTGVSLEGADTCWCHGLGWE